MEQEQIKFGIELPKELHRQVKIAAATRGLKMKEASEQAFAGWLASAGEGTRHSQRAPSHAQVAPSTAFGDLTSEEEQFVAWLLALVRQKRRAPSAEIALQAVRLAGAEVLGEKSVTAHRKQKVG